jgi:hypothetical protein
MSGQRGYPPRGYLAHPQYLGSSDLRIFVLLISILVITATAVIDAILLILIYIPLTVVTVLPLNAL